MQALTVKNLKKVYANGVVALNGIDLNVRQGDFFGLLGPNGAGKSTTIGILCSLVIKTSGQVQVFEYDLDQDSEGAKSCMGVVPQELNFSTFEKIFQIIITQAGYYGIPSSIAKKRAEFYLKKMGLWEWHDRPLMSLSGGMKRRLMIARALVNQPKLLILDEPTAGVDVELRHILWHFLAELNNQGTTIILTTHYLEEAEHLCKNVAIIDRGAIIEQDNVKSLINRLDIQTIVLDLAQPISKVPEPNDFNFRLIDATTLEVEIRKQQSLNHLFQELNKLNITVISLRNKTNRLEELFVNLISENKGKNS